MYDQIYASDHSAHKLAFFVDKDFDESINRPGLYETECYSIENYYVYPPVKFANRLSVMNLKLDSEKINYNIIQLTENNFNASTDTLSMMDTISQIMIGEALNGKTTPQKLAALKRTQMDDVKLKDFAIQNHNNTPIDIVLNDISRYYKRQSLARFQLLGRVFQNNELTDQLVTILKDSCSYYLRYQEINEKTYQDLDGLMKIK